MARARVFKSEGAWEWICLTCHNFNGIPTSWWLALHAANCHVRAHDRAA